MISVRFLLFIFILNISVLKSQILRESLSNNDIRSVQFSPVNFNLGYPILTEGKNAPLQLQFDLMGEMQAALAYRILHCDANWTKSDILSSEFLTNSFNEFYIDNYELSSSTQRLYTHYVLRISSDQLKLSGNYIVQVFPENNPEETWLQTRFVYAESKVTVSGQVKRDNASDSNQTHQRVSFEVKYNKANFPFPRTNISATILQNLRWESSQTLSPLFIDNNTLRFTYIDKKGLFLGNYEFPYFDTSTILQETHSIRTLEQDENGEMHCYLYPNEMAANNYFYIKDMNGNWTVKAEKTFTPSTEADYVWTHFTLASKELSTPVFVVGRFNQWQTSAENLMSYNQELGVYHLGLLLKQGVYNYTFISQEPKGDFSNLLGSYSETENDYYIFIYYHDERLQTDRLIGWERLNSTEK